MSEGVPEARTAIAIAEQLGLTADQVSQFAKKHAKDEARRRFEKLAAWLAGGQLTKPRWCYSYAGDFGSSSWGFGL